MNVDSVRGGWGADRRMPDLILSALGAAWVVARVILSNHLIQRQPRPSKMLRRGRPPDLRYVRICC